MMGVRVIGRIRPLKTDQWPHDGRSIGSFQEFRQDFPSIKGVGFCSISPAVSPIIFEIWFREGILNKIAGRWRIKWMEMWDQDFVDLVEPGYFQFDDDDLGFFVFGAVEGQIDYRISDDNDRVDFSWSGNDDGDLKSGRGWF